MLLVHILFGLVTLLFIVSIIPNPLDRKRERSAGL